MGIETKKNKVRISGELTIYVTNEFKDILQPVLEEMPKIDLDLSEVSELDSSGLQFLMALKQLKTKDNEPRVNIVDHSAVVKQTLELLNLNTEFADPILLLAKEGK